MKHLLTAMIFAISCIFTIQAQNYVQGKVVDKDGNPVLGAKVYSDEGETAVSDFDGSFRLETKNPAKNVYVEYVGMGKKKARVKSSEDIILQFGDGGSNSAYYQGELNFGYSYGPLFKDHKISFETVQGARINKYFFAGLGFGVHSFVGENNPQYQDYYNGYGSILHDYDFVDKLALSFSADLRAYWPVSDKFQPYVGIDLGYYLSIESKFYRGLYFTAGAGFNWRRLTFEAGYERSGGIGDYVKYENGEEDLSSAYPRSSFYTKLGLNFNSSKLKERRGEKKPLYRDDCGRWICANYQGEFNTGYSYSPTAEIHRYKFETTHGVRLNKYLYSGVGVGFEFNLDECEEFALPIFVDLRAYWPVNEKFNPYIGVDAGYYMSVDPDDYRGAYFNTGLGFNANRFNFEIGYELTGHNKNASTSYWVIDGYNYWTGSYGHTEYSHYKVSELCHGVYVKLGINFNNIKR